MGPEGWGGTNQAKSRGSFPGKGTACAKALGWENQEAWHRTEVNRAGAEGARGDGGRWGLITWVPSRGPEKTPQCLREKSDVSGLWGNSPSAVLEQWVEHSGRGWGSQPGGEWFSQQLHLGGQCPQGSRRACSCADVGWTHVASALPTCLSQVTHIRPTKSLWQQYLSWNPIWRQRFSSFIWWWWQGYCQLPVSPCPSLICRKLTHVFFGAHVRQIVLTIGVSVKLV